MINSKHFKETIFLNETIAYFISFQKQNKRRKQNGGNKNRTIFEDYLSKSIQQSCIDVINYVTIVSGNYAWKGTNYNSEFFIFSYQVRFIFNVSNFKKIQANIQMDNKIILRQLELIKLRTRLYAIRWWGIEQWSVVTWFLLQILTSFFMLKIVAYFIRTVYAVC